MKLPFVCTFFLSILNLLVVAQAPVTGSDNGTRPLNTGGSNIVHSFLSDTADLPLLVENACYDPFKNKLPFYPQSYITAYNQSAKPVLVVKKWLLVEDKHALVIKKYFSPYLSQSFQLEAGSSFHKNKNLNQYKLFPFRKNASDQIEELVDFEIKWEILNSSSPAARGAAYNFTTSSVMASGNWYKLGVTQTGMYKLSKSFLSNMGLNVNNLDPAKIRVYGNGGKMLPELNQSFRYDDLQETAIQFVGDSNNVWENSEYFLFYATGTTDWINNRKTSGLKFTATKNLYSDTSFYFVTADLGNGKRMPRQNSLNSPANYSTSSYDYYNYHEDNLVNFGKSGRGFYGEYFDIVSSYRFNWNEGDFVVGDTVWAQADLIAASTQITQFGVSGNGLNFSVYTGTINVGELHAEYAAPGSTTGFGINNNKSELAVTISKLTSKSQGWLDKLTINARRSISYTNKQFQFRDNRSAGLGKTCAYTISTAPNLVLGIWNVSDPIHPFIQDYVTNAGSISFTALNDSASEYAIGSTVDYYTPQYVGKVANQNLHSLNQADYVIVTHPLFLKEAQQLALFHQKNEGLSYAIATTEQIYNEFSSGRQDISAIRDFIRMLYSRNISLGKEVRYVLLMGDGSYNNMSRSLVNNSNLIPTYQSINSLSSTQSIATDDFFGLMDPDEGYNAENHGLIDIGVGRFTCRSANEVKAILAKIENYYKKDPNFTVNTATAENCNNLSESPMGDWRNWLLFLGDDEDGALHMRDANKLTTLVRNSFPNYNVDKIFLDAYQRFSTPGGARYPDASTDFVKRIKKGTLIFNYTGHGGEVGLTAERMVDLDMINNLDNFNKLPLFITATCEFSRYDDPSRTSAGELCLLNPKGGAIALLTTCRLAFSGPNYDLNRVLLGNLFTKLPDGTRPALGDAIMATKASPQLPGQQYVYANFHLLGDPALKLSYPELQVSTSKINNVAITSSSSDTLGALSKITVGGFISDDLGNKMSNFNGLVYPTVFDKEQTVTCLMNLSTSADDSKLVDPFPPFQFLLQKNILYRGKTQVVNGNFSFSFIVPKDISFAPGPGKISYYATNGLTDANGNYKQLIVGGGSAKNTLVDNDGPQANLFFNDKTFVNGGITNEKPVFYADLTDSSGINTLGTGIGHDISAILDETSTKPVILNDYYEANLNSYQSGRVRYPFDQLSEGNHRLSFKVWDIQNNSSTVYTDFIVAPSAELALKHVLNYPNPFTTNTKFIFEHNQACNPLKVTIQVYTVSGKMVKTIQKTVVCEGFKPEGIEWDGKDDYGDKLARGVYIYKLAILDVENKKAEKIEKLVILN